MQRTCQLVLFIAILAVGCGDRPRPRPAPVDPDKDVVVKKDDAGKDGTPKKDGGKVIPVTPATDRIGDEILAALPEPTKKELAEARMLKAIDLIAEDKFEEALTELEEAQKLDDSGPVQREITKVQTVLAQREGAARAVSDVKSVLEDGKPEEAARLAAEALGSYGGGDDAEELAKLAQQAEAEVTAAAGNVAAREAKLRSDAEAALKDDNLRAAAIALEQAQSIAPGDEIGRRLDDLREKLRVYDESRAKAAALRRDPARLGEAVDHLETAAKVWPTLHVRQQIDQYRLAMERRRDRLTVAPFEIRADLGFPAAGEMISESLLPHFKRRFDLVERAQLSRLAEEMKLETSGLFETNAGRRELGELSKVRYMVVGSVSPVGGITVQARLVEVATGLIVQTARVSAPTIEELEKNRLPQLAIMLQLNDEEKAAYEDRLAREVPVVTALSAAAVTDIPPPPPVEEAVAAKALPIVTMTAARIPQGGIVIEDFNRLPPVFITAVAPPPQPPLVVALETYPERRNRMLALSLMLGDNLFRRGRVQEAQRHFGIAFSLAGPRREISLRLDACRAVAPPPPPPFMVIPPRPVVVVRPPFGIPIAPPRPPVVIVAPVRPRLAVFGFVPGLPTLVPPGATDALADQLASYLGGRYEIIDRGEVCWYMGKLGMTMREVLNDPVARRCLAQSLNARYFVFGTLRATGSFDVDAHLFDAETNQRTATANMHVRDHNEMKLRLGELARQLGAMPEEKKAIAAAGAASEKALSDARGLLASDPAGAAKVARAGLDKNPDSVALRSLIAEADARVAQAKLKAQRDAEMARQLAAVALAKKKQADLALAAAAAREKAEAAARLRGDAEKKALADQRNKAAESMRAQAKVALARGDSAGAVKLLQSASSLQPRDDIFKELAAARAKADTDSKAKILSDQKTAAEKTQKDRAAIQAKLDAAKARRDAEAKGQTETKDAHDKVVSTSFLKQAQAAYDKKEYGKAMDLAQSARRVLPSAEATDLYRKAQDALTLEKADDAQRAKFAEERKQAARAEALGQKKRQDYAEAVTKAQTLAKAGKYDEAEKEYEAAGKLFNTAVVSEGLKAIASLRADQKKAADDARKIKDGELTKVARVKTLTTTAEGLSKKGDHAGAVKAYREALGLMPGDVTLLTSLSKAEDELKRGKERDDRIAAAKKGKAEALKLIAAGKVQMAAKKHDVAAELFRRALVQDATNAEAKSLLAQAEKLGPMGGKKADYELAMSAGKSAFDKGNYKGAMNAYRVALGIFPSDAEATKAFADAEARDKAAMAGEKTKAYDAAMKRGNALLTGNKFKEAREAFDDALVAKPGDALAVAGKRKAEAGLTPDPKKAVYAKAIAGAAAAYKAGKYADALKQYDDALEAIPGDKAAIEGKTAAVTALREERYQTAMKSGNALLAGRKWKEAGTFFEQALKLKPGDKAATAGKAKAEAGEKPDPKKVAYDKAMAAARAALAADKYGEAVKHYNDALDAVPGDRAAIDGKAAALKEATEAAYQGHLKNGQRLLAAKKFKEAEAAFDQALKLKPGDPAAIKGKREAEAGGKPPVNPKKVAYDRAMAEASAALKAGKNEDAKKAYERAIAAMPDMKEAEAGLAEATKRANAEAYVATMKRGQALMTDKKFKEAEAAYDTALRLKPGDAAAVAGKKAAQAAQKPMEPPKKSAEFNREFSEAQTLEKSGKVAQALAAYRNALKAVADDVGRKPEQARAYAGIGRCEHARKNFDEAVTAYEEALKRTPMDATVKAALARAKKKM